MICIADIPIGSLVKVTVVDGTIEGIVVANYGACLGIKEAKNSAVLVSNTIIQKVELLGCDTVTAFEIKHGVERAKFKQLLESMNQ